MEPSLRSKIIKIKLKKISFKIKSIIFRVEQTMLGFYLERIKQIFGQ